VHATTEGRRSCDRRRRRRARSTEVALESSRVDSIPLVRPIVVSVVSVVSVRPVDRPSDSAPGGLNRNSFLIRRSRRDRRRVFVRGRRTRSGKRVIGGVERRRTRSVVSSDAGRDSFDHQNRIHSFVPLGDCLISTRTNRDVGAARNAAARTQAV
jgi:hypothetical protein